MLTGSSLPFSDLSADKSTPLLCLINGFQMVACITLTSLRAVSVYLHVKWLFEQLYRSWVTGFSLHLISQAAVLWQLVDIRLYSQSLLKLRDVLRQRERGDREQLSLAFTPHPSLAVLLFFFFFLSLFFLTLPLFVFCVFLACFYLSFILFLSLFVVFFSFIQYFLFPLLFSFSSYLIFFILLLLPFCLSIFVPFFLSSFPFVFPPFQYLY